MTQAFPQLAMAGFSEKFKGRRFQNMHATNPQAFSRVELEATIGMSFNEILQDVDLGFAPDAGTADLRRTLSDYHYENCTESNIITHAGAQEALFCAFYALLRTGDKVLAVAPVFEPLVQIPLNIGCNVDYIHLNKQNNWSLDIDSVEKYFQQGCKLFIINFPHNPTGATITEPELMSIVALCAKYNVWLLSDEVFRGLEHERSKRLPAVADIYNKGISIGVISKAFAVPGIRVGWLACCDHQLIDKVLDIKGYLSICNSQIDEKLASVILKQPEKLLQRNLKIILKNKSFLTNFDRIYQSNVKFTLPHSGCCLFAEIDDDISSSDLIEQLINKNNYLLYPSSLFKTDTKALRVGFGSTLFESFIQDVQS